MIYALTIAILMAGAVYLVLQRGMVRIVFGMSLFGHASNLTILAAGNGAWRGEAFPSSTGLEDMSDPLPQAFVLTAIVIAMATTTILLMLAALGRDDDTLDNILDAEQAEKIGPGALTTTGRTAYRGVRK
ncbi:cation:proton antiporter subunit C [Corynebacterium genitalium ATCC 33030]|uniref:Monovalent cation/H+ antiporter subunit C n=1 Tax=Corynebacterium genitalium ATCC 33030 TaxID=585529 RepID=D7WBE4_9CORY|nr:MULTISPECIES: cation:proton antiporter subunit C [Corynebacterium]EFK55175.1 putative monovalent cation/H+ antiporter subunit C [Corynebacterium genitalium ATCC 33030]MCQ4621709.1 cation:proton antiporter subunit C [Corynebacterium sp. CCUG 71335]MCQ4622622.1 cation:proton antiporter subunit C [Corynebacterium sp. CCUG 70398]MCQ4625912.1 cation:proton antiporter subunit C [Corynebacterium sp. CCUG 69979]MCQ4626228.1 cation:proton antiporter subunit C [Corynebacterium sp. CCUG 65737]